MVATLYRPLTPPKSAKSRIYTYFPATGDNPLTGYVHVTDGNARSSVTRVYDVMELSPDGFRRVFLVTKRVDTSVRGEGTLHAAYKCHVPTVEMVPGFCTCEAGQRGNGCVHQTVMLDVLDTGAIPDPRDSGCDRAQCSYTDQYPC